MIGLLKLGIIFIYKVYYRIWYYKALFSKDDIINLMKKAGFRDFECKENLYGDSLDNLKFEINECNGGAFKVIRGRK